MVCISYLELSGSPSHLRYLLRRLRRHLPPDVRVLVGLWPAGEAILQDERMHAAVGADYYTSSLHEAVAGVPGGRSQGARSMSNHDRRCRRRRSEGAATPCASPLTNGAKE